MQEISPDLAVILPVFNEEATVGDVITAVLQQPCVRQVIAVDDGSADRTYDRILRSAQKDSRILVLRHSGNQGKGCAIRSALPHVETPYAIIQDADLEYNPECYETMLTQLREGKADVVYGNRFVPANHFNGFGQVTANRTLTLIARLLSRWPLSDEATCYKMFRSDLLMQCPLRERRFGFCPEVTMKLSRLGARYAEVPVEYTGRTRAEGKKIGMMDFISAVRCLVQYRFAPLARRPAPSNTGLQD